NYKNGTSVGMVVVLIGYDVTTGKLEMTRGTERGQFQFLYAQGIRRSEAAPPVAPSIRVSQQGRMAWQACRRMRPGFMAGRWEAGSNRGISRRQAEEHTSELQSRENLVC